MRAILVVIVFAVCFAAKAQDIIWHKGSVVLVNNEVLVGDVARGGFDLLLLKDLEGTVTVFPAHKVSSFRYHDVEENVNRAFVTMGNKYYERVVFGKISVFRIQKFFDQKINENNADAFKFFIERDKRVCSLNQFRKKYFDHVKEELDLRMVSHKNLDPNTDHGAVSLILLYNKSKGQVLSSI